MNILNSLKKSENMRKIFGKKELIIIEKQLMGIRLKPSEKTRLSRDIRKKFEAIKELSPFINNFNLKHGEITKEKIDLQVFNALPEKIKSEILKKGKVIYERKN